MATNFTALGKLFDIGTGAIIQSLNGSGITGKNCSLENCQGVGVLITKMANGTRIQTRLMPSANRVNRAFAPSMYGIP